MTSGADQGGPVCSLERQTPCAFNTGMVLDGWVSAYAFCQERRYLEAACRAADWLVSDMSAAGYFRTNGQFLEPRLIKTYNIPCACALDRRGGLAPATTYQTARIRSVDAPLRQQQRQR